MGRSKRTRVLGVFEHGCNLINEHREVASVVSQVIGNGPFHIVADEPIAFPDVLSSDSTVLVMPHRLTLNGVSIELGQTRVWQATPDWGALHLLRTRLVQQLGDLERWIAAHAPAESLMAYAEIAFVDVPDSTRRAASALGIGTQLSLKIRSAAAELSGAVRRADTTVYTNAARALAGRGQGLTPAGDDFILGAMYAAWILHPPEFASRIAHAMAAVAVPRTTSLSAAWLQAGARGEASARWHALFEALLGGHSPGVHDAIERILATGHTSGADGLAGLLDGLGIRVGRELRLCHSLTP